MSGRASFSGQSSGRCPPQWPRHRLGLGVKFSTGFPCNGSIARGVFWPEKPCGASALALNRQRCSRGSEAPTALGHPVIPARGRSIGAVGRSAARGSFAWLHRSSTASRASSSTSSRCLDGSGPGHVQAIERIEVPLGEAGVGDAVENVLPSPRSSVLAIDIDEFAASASVGCDQRNRADQSWFPPSVDLVLLCDVLRAACSSTQPALAGSESLRIRRISPSEIVNLSQRRLRRAVRLRFPGRRPSTSCRGVRLPPRLPDW